MKKPLAIVISCIAFLIVCNIYYFRDTYLWQIDTQKTILAKQINSCHKESNNFIAEIESNSTLLFQEKDLGKLFDLDLESQITKERIELIYNRYYSLLNKLTVIDVKGNSYSLLKGANQSTISKFSKTTRKENFKRDIVIDKNANSFIINQPLYNSTHIYGYLIFDFDLEQYYHKIFKGFNIQGHQFQWIADHHFNLLFSTNKNITSLLTSEIKFISDSTTLYAIHPIKINNINTKTLTVFKQYKLSPNQTINMAFSMPIKPITNSIIKNSFIVAFISFAIILMIVYVFYQYISKNKISQERLYQSEDSLRKILYYTPVGIVLVDSENKIQLVNRFALKLFEYEDEDLLLDREASEKVLFEKKKTLVRSDISESTKKYIFNDATQNKQVVLKDRIPFFNQNNKYYILQFVELTPFELQPTAQEHNQSAQTRFIANISHELRTPLNAIIGMTDMILTSTTIDNTDKDMLTVVKRSADTLLALINDILDFSKIEAGKLEIESIPVNLEKEIKQSLDDFIKLSKERSIDLSWSTDVKLPDHFSTDPLRLKQILNNLLGNAIKFTPSGRVHLHISESKTLNGGSALQFKISDTGIGIRKEKLKIIFNSFSQEDESTTRKFGGTGLGTSISKNLVKLMGGEIWADSPSSISTNPEYPGAEFTFTIPYNNKQKVKNLDYSYVLSYTQINALIITDEAIFVQNIIKNMMALGINYKTMAPSQETIQMLSERNNIQLIIIDQRPDFNGIDFLQQLYSHNLYKNFLILLQSSDYELMNNSLGKKLGADAYLRKPVSLSTLQNLLLKHFKSIKNPINTIGKIVPNDIRILVAEDNLFNQKVAQNLFKKVGYEIDLANNGKEAIQKFKANKYHIIFMDLLMPELDGFDATKELKCYDESCPIIAMTANNDDSQRQLAFKAGMDDFITKPAHKDEITRMIIKYCSQ
ncbi:response regulator [Plebeiibacterium sediminum]|uniref:histidine kinase n=1 Tax=Plebeiibacterium sediminum TaxID=2992112 RepID=A0AAE3SF71_9BACT|nr:response regulator [Plebeiobacterium sediminum]MCW3786737.1 response regulator [Plebeiobacterium sediminum]